MSARVQLFGEFKVTLGNQPAAFLTRPIESLFAYLASRIGKSTPRVEAATATWPGADPEKAVNRLRNALAHLRQTLQPEQIVVADRQNVSLVDIESDLSTAEQLYRRSRIAQDGAEERDSLSSLIAIIGRDFLEGWTEDWTEPPRQFWKERRIEAALRLAGIAMAADDHEKAIAECNRAIEADEFHEEAWATFVRAMGLAGRHTEAVQRFRICRQRRLDELSLDFSPEMIELVKRVSTGKMRKEGSDIQSSVAVRDVMANVLERQMREDPEGMLPLFSTPAFRKEALRDPTEAWKLVHSVLDRTEGIGDDRAKALLLGMRLADMIDEYGTALDYGEWLVENLPVSRAEHRVATNMLGFLYFEMREWDDAWRYLQKFLELAQEYGDANEVAIAKSQIASLHWHLGDFEKARAEYRTQLEQLRMDPSLAGLHNVATLRGNIGMLCAMQGDWREAEKELSLAYSMAITNDFDYVKGQVSTPLGLAKIIAGETLEGRRMASTGLSQTYRSRYRRLHEMVADFAAAALVFTGNRDLGRSVLETYSGFRSQTHHTRTVAEEQFADWIRKESGAEGSAIDLPVSKVVALACDSLESPSANS